jgi:hypothetical protein
MHLGGLHSPNFASGKWHKLDSFAGEENNLAPAVGRSACCLKRYGVNDAVCAEFRQLLLAG